MRENTLRTMWKRGEAAVNGWLSIPSGFSAEVMAHQGFDSLTVDMQHGVVDYQAMVTMLQAVSTTDTVPVVRVPWLEPCNCSCFRYIVLRSSWTTGPARSTR